MSLTQINDYIEKSTTFEKSLDLDYKKDNGIFYTDITLASKIIEFLNIPADAIVLDPCCGTGSFVYSALQANLTNTYGADIDASAVALCKKLTGNKNIKTIDTLANSSESIFKSFKLKEKADFVIGNPPYAPISKDIVIDTQDYLFLRNVKDSGSNLFVAALYRAFELVKDNGYVSYIVPKNLLHVSAYSLIRKKILNEMKIVSIIDIGAYFKNVRGEQIILTLQNKLNSGNNIDLYKYNEGNFIKSLSVPQSYFKDEILLFDNKNDYSIHRSLESTYQKFNDICTGYVGRGKSTNENAVSGKDIKKFGFKTMDVPRSGNQVFIQNIYSAEAGIIASFAGSLEASQTVTIFTDGDEKMCRYIVGILHSRLCNYFLLKFCFNNSKLTMHTDAKYLRKIPLVKKEDSFQKIINIVKALEKIEYMNEDWFLMVESLNELVYDTYDIREEERIYIDAEMKAIQSQRWNNDK